jgi:hypothetical protein
MFNRDVIPRTIALKGFLTVLKSNLENTNRYQNESSVDIEIISNLRRCLSQQFQIREEMYKGFLEILEIKPNLTEPIMNLLLEQFIIYYEKDKKQVPLIIEKCIDKNKIILSEPLGFLMFIIQKIIIIQLKKENSKISEAKVIFDKVADRLTYIKLEDYSFEDSTDFNPTTDEGHGNQILATILLSVLIVMMEYTLLKPKEKIEEKISNVHKYFDLYKKLLNDLKKKSKVKGKKPIDNISIHIPILSYEFTIMIMELLHDKDNDNEIIKNMEFREFLLSIIKSQIEMVFYFKF